MILMIRSLGCTTRRKGGGGGGGGGEEDYEFIRTIL
jgi:hypothetical protein